MDYCRQNSFSQSKNVPCGQDTSTFRQSLVIAPTENHNTGPPPIPHSTALWNYTS